MARDVESLALCMRALLCPDMFTLDPTVPPIPFNQQVYESSEPLRIGYYENDGYFQPSPSMSRALLETKELLEKAGHTLIPFNLPRIFTAFHEFVVRGNTADGCVTLLKHFEEGPVDPCMQHQFRHWGFPSIHAWPQLYTPPVESAALSYTALYNVLNFPAGVVPVTEVTAEDEDQLNHYSGYFGDAGDKTFFEAIRGGVGLPIAVQCVALPWQEEMCLRLMREVEKLCAKNKFSNTHH